MIDRHGGNFTVIRDVNHRPRNGRRGGNRALKVIAIAGGASAVIFGWAAWLGITASAVASELNSAHQLIPTLKSEVAATNQDRAISIAEDMRAHTSRAKDAVDQPLWMLATAVPFIGPNFSAVTELARSSDDVVSLGITPLVRVYESLNWDKLLPSSSAGDLSPIEAASSAVGSASSAVKMSAERLALVDTTRLLRSVAIPFEEARNQLHDATGAMAAAADASQLAPEMLGSQGPRSYLLVVQNNAEVRASGGIPGALAVINLDRGKLTLGAQSSASDLGALSPALAVEQQQEQIYSTRPGKYMQDVNLTPDFPSAALMARMMWEKKTGQRVDGVVSIDPVVLSYILKATGPINLRHSGLSAALAVGLPTELTGENVVPTLLSDVYSRINQPKLQDDYFAAVAAEVFSALSSGKGEAKSILTGISKGTEEGRVLVWSGDPSEQSVITKYSLSGAISGPSISPAQFGLYFNDGTGAKMDYYVKHTVQLVKECPADGYEEITVRVTSSNTAPTDAAQSLPAYVTGGGLFGVVPGSVQTNVIAYGPVQSQVESAKLDGKKVAFAPYLHSNRPVGVIAQKLAPGETKVLDFTFGKIVQHTEPALAVTPTVQPLNEVILPTENPPCDPGQ